MRFEAIRNVFKPKMMMQHRPQDASEALIYAHPQCVTEVHAAFDGTMMALGQALELRDFETQGHTQRVVDLTLKMADALSLSAQETRALRWGAYLHDIGKLAIPDQVLLKPSKLDAEERALIEKHTMYGCMMLEKVPMLPESTIAMVKCHHERWDGAGYPDKIAGESIPLCARLFAIIDVYDALINKRPYKRAWTLEETVDELNAQAEKHFDPELLGIFLNVVVA